MVRGSPRFCGGIFRTGSKNIYRKCRQKKRSISNISILYFSIVTTAPRAAHGFCAKKPHPQQLCTLVDVKAGCSRLTNYRGFLCRIAMKQILLRQFYHENQVVGCSARRTHDPAGVGWAPYCSFTSASNTARKTRQTDPYKDESRGDSDVALGLQHTVTERIGRDRNFFHGLGRGRSKLFPYSGGSKYRIPCRNGFQWYGCTNTVGEGVELCDPRYK